MEAKIDENNGKEEEDDDDLEHEFLTNEEDLEDAFSRRGGGQLVASSSSSDEHDEDEEKIQIPTVRPREEDAKTSDIETVRSMRLIEKLYETVVNPVNKLEPEMRKLTSAELRAKTLEFRARLRLGETLEDVLVEAFAAVREASRRELGLRHFDAVSYTHLTLPTILRV